MTDKDPKNRPEDSDRPEDEEHLPDDLQNLEPDDLEDLQPVDLGPLDLSDLDLEPLDSEPLNLEPADLQPLGEGSDLQGDEPLDLEPIEEGESANVLDVEPSAEGQNLDDTVDFDTPITLEEPFRQPLMGSGGPILGPPTLGSTGEKTVRMEGSSRKDPNQTIGMDSPTPPDTGPQTTADSSGQTIQMNAGDAERSGGPADDDRQLNQTVDADAPLVPPANISGGALPTTPDGPFDESRLGQTVDADGPLTGPPTVADSGQTIDMDQPLDESRLGQTVDADGPLTGPPTVADSGQTIDMDQPLDESRLGQTVDADGPLTGPPTVADSGQTIDMDQPLDESRLGQTVDADGPLTGPPTVADSGQTIDMDQPLDESRLGQTVDADGPLTGPPTVADSGQTIDMDQPLDESRLGQTVDADGPLTGPPTVADSGQTIDMDQPLDESRLGQTVDADGPLTGPPTVADSGQTIDMDNMGDDPNRTIDMNVGGQTVDADAPGFGQPPKPGTVSDFSAQTIDAEVNKPGTVRKEHDQTVQGGGQGSGTSRGRDATFDSSVLTSQSANRLMVLWSSVNKATQPGATIQGQDGSEDDKRQTQLVIQNRDLRDIKDISTEGADYELMRRLGEGGMGVVYMARQSSIDRTVAIKMLKPEGAKDQKQRVKFLAEAVVTGELDHPNIVPIYDMGAKQDGALFYSMKRVVGTPWDDVVHKKTLSENIEILMKCADAVAFAHAKGVIHRDLKPENVMLGDFGEVLVMDWGLAVAIAQTKTCSMGGTPAYMAPEMAAGPFDKIGICSDIYLLGAMLFEIITNKPPHTGKDVMKCLFAAAKNQIRQTDKKGELMNVAMKAMATEPEDRYATVQEFQDAIRDYSAHAESIMLTRKSYEELEEARKEKDYRIFARSIFGFEEAIDQWAENERAKTGIAEARIAYATAALEKSDFDLGLSILDENNPHHQTLRGKLLEAQKEREAKTKRLKLLTRAVGVLAVAIIGIVTIAFFAVNTQRIRAVKSEETAKVEAQNARKAEGEARTAEGVANVEKKRAESEAQKARTAEGVAKVEADNARRAETKAVDAQLVAEKNEMLAKKGRMAAEMARLQEEEAKKDAIVAKQKAEYEEYIALIGLAAAKIDENAYDIARELLKECRDDLRDWEWGRLMHLCQQHVANYENKAPVEGVAISQAGDLLAGGGWNGKAHIWARAGQEPLHVLEHGKNVRVHSVAFSPDGKLLATASSAKNGGLKLWNTETGELVRTFEGHTGAVLSVKFNKTGKRLLSTSYDKTARLWNINGQEEKKFIGHNWWVWDAALSPDETQIVTGGQDGMAYVWNVKTGEHGPAFDEHVGPVFAVAFAPDGKSVATGGHDKRVLVWKTADVKKHNFKDVLEGKPPIKTKYVEMTGHTAAVRSLMFSTDGKRILSGSDDNSVKVWGIRNARSLKTLRGHGSLVHGCAFTQDGKYALSGSYDKNLKLWDINGYQEARVLQGRVFDGHVDALLGASFSQDGQFVLTAGRDRIAKMWNTVTGQELQTYREGHAFLTSNAVFFDGDKRLATSAVDNTTRIWDVAAGTELVRVRGTGRRTPLAISSDGAWMATGGDNATVQIWEIAPLLDRENNQDEASLKAKLQMKGHSGDITCVAFSADGSTLVSGDTRGRVMIWNAATGERKIQLLKHTKGITGVSFLAGDKLLATASLDGTVTLWDGDTFEEQDKLLRHPEPVLALTISDDGQQVVTSSDDGMVRIWDPVEASLEQSIDLGKGIYSLAINSAGDLVTTDSDKGLVQVWNVETGKEVKLPTMDGQEAVSFLDIGKRGGIVWAATFTNDGTRVLTLGGDSARLWNLQDAKQQMSFSPHGAIASAHFSKDGSRVVTGSWDSSARIWDAQGKAVLKLDRSVAGENAHKGRVNSAIFSPDDAGRWVLTASDDRTAKLWDSQTAQVIRTFEGHRAGVRSAVFSPDGKLVLTASNDRLARIFNTETAELLCEMSGHSQGLRHAIFSADAKRVVTGSSDDTAAVWNVENLAQPVREHELRGHTATVTSVAISPNGDRVLTGCEDFTAKLWDAKTGKEILTLAGHSQEVMSVAFSSNGMTALTSSQDGAAILWVAENWKAGPAAGE